jgi:2-polyprenyl-6-methoxyphenol hydroxylase-like FAD-dependent oxidoreductase/ureidoglycolate hydrolase
MKVVVAGAGIAANVLLRQLRQRADPELEVRAYELRTYQDASPPGLNVLMNHNGLASIKECDPELYEAFHALQGSPMRNWSARTMSGEILYHLEDVVASGDAAVPSLVARWNEIHEATRVDELTEYNVKVVQVVVEEGKETLAVKLLRYKENDANANGQAEEPVEEWVTGVDLVVAADGRYSAIREQLAPTPTYYGPPYCADFRIVAQGVDVSFLTDDVPMWRVYNKPNTAAILQEEAYANNPGVVAAASGYVRVGIMKLGEDLIGVFGNVKLADGGKVDDAVKSTEVLVRLFEPAAGDPEPDHMGKVVLQVLQSHGAEAHWSRKQQTETCYSALDNRVLFIGDAAGAIYPSLGQGANLSLEDATVAAACFPDVATIASLRSDRRHFIKDMSRKHAMHIAFRDTFEEEINNWNDPECEWRANLRRLWCSGKQLALRAVTATKENFAPYGQLISESLDGDVFDPLTSDASLDLSRGAPRLYLMKLTGGRPMRASQITRHRQVTQCLGALGTTEDFYLVVHEPGDHLGIKGLQAMRIPPRHFVKLHVGTWHVGPMWTGDDLDRTFMNLELADTNVTDHDTVEFQTLLPGANEKDEPLVIPVLAVSPS